MSGPVRLTVCLLLLAFGQGCGQAQKEQDISPKPATEIPTANKPPESNAAQESSEQTQKANEIVDTKTSVQVTKDKKDADSSAAIDAIYEKLDQTEWVHEKLALAFAAMQAVLGEKGPSPPLVTDKVPSADNQKMIIDRIAGMGPKAARAVPALTEILRQDTPVELKQQILELIPKLGPAAQSMGRIVAYTSRDVRLRATAVKVVIQLGCEDPACIEAIGESLQNEELRAASLAMLTKLDGEMAIPASRFLLELAVLKQAPLDMRVAAIDVISKFNRDGLGVLWDDESPVIRKAAAKMGVDIGRRLIEETDPDVLAAAFEGLGRTPIRPAHLALVFSQALKNEALHPAIKTFLKQHPEQVIGILFKLFKSDTTMIREYSVDLLAELEVDKTIRTNLEAVLKQADDSGMQTLAAIKLGEIPEGMDEVEFAVGVGKWISQKKLQGRVLALLAKLGAPAIPALTQLAIDSRLESELKAQVLEILAKQPDAASVAEPFLKQNLKSEDSSTRYWAAVVMTRVSRDDSEETLAILSPVAKEILKSPDSALVRVTLLALGERTKLATGISESILSTLKHADPNVRIAAIQTSAKFGSAAKIPGVLDALKKTLAEDADASVKKQAADSVKEYEEAVKSP